MPSVGSATWQEPLRAGAVAAWVRLRAEQHLTEVEHAAHRIRRIAAEHAAQIIDGARHEAESLRSQTEVDLRRRLADVELEITQWLHEAQAERDAIVTAATQERAALLTEARVRAEQDLNTVLGLIEALLAEAEVETSERRRLANLAADEIIAAARSEAARVAAGAWPGPVNSHTDEVAARRLRTEQEQRRIS